MKHTKPIIRNTLLLLAGTLSILLALPISAATDAEQALQAEEKELQQQLQVEYEKAMVAAERERLAAEASMEKAREQLSEVSEQQREQARASAEEARQSREVQQARMAEMHQELNRARRELRNATREIARVDREVARARAERADLARNDRTSSRPLIGVILGEPTDVGVMVLGVSPDGPSERAGVQQGDVIIAIGGQVLAAVEGSDDPREALRIAMADVKAEEPLTITLERGDKTVDLTVVPEVREPMSWQTITRFPSAAHVVVKPSSPQEASEVITIERVVVPEIDTEKIAEQIETMRIQIKQHGEIIEERVAPVDGHYDEFYDRNYEIEFHELSEMGDFALSDANIWFGLPLTRGLKLAEIDADLGDYFKTDRGVLVLKAKQDNELQLVSGDVILQVGDTEVNSPAEFMRALRGVEPGEEVEMDIKRKRKNRTLKLLMPENRNSFFHSSDDKTHRYEFTTSND